MIKYEPRDPPDLVCQRCNKKINDYPTQVDRNAVLVDKYIHFNCMTKAEMSHFKTNMKRCPRCRRQVKPKDGKVSVAGVGQIHMLCATFDEMKPFVLRMSDVLECADLDGLADKLDEEFLAAGGSQKGVDKRKAQRKKS